MIQTTNQLPKWLLGYDYKLRHTDNAVVQKYRDSTTYQLGFDGAKNGNETEACITFSYRDVAICQNAYYYSQADNLGISDWYTVGS